VGQFDRSGEELDARLSAATDLFLKRQEDLATTATSDAEKIRTLFLDSFQDGDPRRALELVAVSKEVATSLQRFHIHASSMTGLLAFHLLLKDLAGKRAIMVAALANKELGDVMLKEVEQIYSYIEAFRRGEDPGPLPNITTLDRIRENQRGMQALLNTSFDIGEDVAATIEMMADTIELRIAYLSGFKLSHLPLDPWETLERIASRFQNQPASIARKTALNLLKGTIVAVGSDLVEKHLPWSTVRDIFERLELSLVGERVDTKPGAADALLNLSGELKRQEEAFLKLYADCSEQVDEMNKQIERMSIIEKAHRDLGTN